MTKELIDGLETVCKLAGADRETTRRIVSAAKGDEAPKPGEKLLTTRAAAGVLECHPKSVFRYARRGLLKPVRRSDRNVRWRASEVERLAFEGVGA